MNILLNLSVLNKLFNLKSGKYLFIIDSDYGLKTIESCKTEEKSKKQSTCVK